MLMGIELVKDRETKEKFPNEIEVSNRLSEKFKEHGLILVASKGIITVAPPISTTREETDEIVAAFDASIGDLERELGM